MKMLKKTLLIAILVLSLTLINTHQTAIRTNAQPSWISDKREIHTGKMIVRVPKNQPEYLISPKGITSSGYLIKFMQIIEFQDNNGNNLLDEEDKVLSMGILCDKSSWEISVKQNKTMLQVNFSSWIRVIYHGHGGGPPKKAFIKITSTIFAHDKRINNYDIEGEDEIKLDILIVNWPWRTDKSELSLRILFSTYSEEHANLGKNVLHHHKKDSARHMDLLALRDPELSYGILFRVNSFLLIDGLNKSILGVVWRNNNTLEIIYPHFSKILIHDPSLRMIELINQKIGFIGFTTGVIVAVVSIALSIVTVMKFRERLLAKRS